MHWARKHAVMLSDLIIVRRETRHDMLGSRVYLRTSHI